MLRPAKFNYKEVNTTVVYGVKFSICEMNESGIKDYNLDKRTRFFLMVNDTFVYGLEMANHYYSISNDKRYDLYCMTKQDCYNTIAVFKKHAEYIRQDKRLIEVFKNNEKSVKVVKDRLNGRLEDITNIYGFEPIF